METHYLYEAFISYRHCPFDKAIAGLIHKLLETYRLPGHLSLKKVFLDNKELPTSSDLSKSIQDALLQSRFLIVICSMETPHSRWVDQEVETFVQQGWQDRIISILINGSPEMSYPSALRHLYTHNSGCQTIDLRTTSIAQSKKMLHKKIYDILSILTCQDASELMEKGMKRRSFRFLITSIVVSAALVVFGFLALGGTLWTYDMNTHLEYRSYMVSDFIQTFLADSRSAFLSSKESAYLGIEALKKNEAALYDLLQDDLFLKASEQFKEPSDYHSSAEMDIIQSLVDNYLFQGDLYCYLEEYDFGRQCYEKVLEVWLSCKKQYQKSLYYMNRHDARLITLYAQLGDFYMKRGLYDTAYPNYLSGLQTFQQLQHRNDKENFEVKNIRSVIGRIHYHLGEISFQKYDLSLALQAFSEAKTILKENLEWEKSLGILSTDETRKKHILKNYDRLRYIYQSLGERSLMELLLYEEIVIREALAERSSDWDNRHHLAQCYFYLVYYVPQSSEEDVREMMQTEYTLRLALDREWSENNASTENYAFHLLRLGHLHHVNQNAAEAEEAYRKSYALMEQTLPLNASTLSKYWLFQEIAWHYVDSYVLLFEQGKLDEALNQCRRDLLWAETLYDAETIENHPSIREITERIVGDIHLAQSHALFLKEDFANSLDFAQKGILLHKPLYEKNVRSSLPLLYLQAARALLLQKNYEQAQDLAYQATLINNGYIPFHITLAHTYLFTGRQDAAMRIYHQYKDVMVGDTKYGQRILEDFSLLKRYDLTHPAMEEIEKLLQ